MIILLRRIGNLIKAHWIISILIVLVVAGGGYGYYVTRQPKTYQFVPVTRGSITETVSVTGNTTPLQSVSLGFQSGGTIAQVYHALGEQVRAGDALASLNTASLEAALAQAEAAYSSAVASRSATSLPAAAGAARDAYTGAYTTLDTVLHSDVDTFFGAHTAYGPQLILNAPMYGFGELSKDRTRLELSLSSYHDSLSSVSTTDPDVLLTNAVAFTTSVSAFLNKIAVAANAQNSSASAAQLSALATARSSVDTLAAKLSAASDTYRTSSVGATSLADAQVEQAAAGVKAAKANLANATMVAPIGGVITQMDAKVGQIATPGATLVSIISAGGFEVDAGVPETDIGKITVGDAVSMTLDAFPGQTFTGKVFYIDPAQTVNQGVVDYKIKISFTMPDPRMKSGLTANVDVTTDHKDDVVVLPQYAILQNDEGTFVQKVVDGSVVTIPVTLGLQDEQGNVEIASGVSEGEQVLNIGLKH